MEDGWPSERDLFNELQQVLNLACNSLDGVPGADVYAEKLPPSLFELYVMLKELCSQRGNCTDHFLEKKSRIAELFPGCGAVFYAVGVVALWGVCGNVAAALSLEESVEINPSSETVWDCLERVYQALGDESKAESTRNRLISQNFPPWSGTARTAYCIPHPPLPIEPERAVPEVVDVREIIFETVRKCLSERVGDTADSAVLSELVFETYKDFGLQQPTIIRFESPLKGCLAVGQINTLSEIHSLTRNVSFEVTKELLPVLQAVEPNLAAWESAVRFCPIEPLRQYDLHINYRPIEHDPDRRLRLELWENQLQHCVEEALAKELELSLDDRSRWSFINNDIHQLIYGQVANEVLAHIHKQIDLPITHSALCHRYASAIRQACRSAHPGALWEHLPLRQAEQLSGGSVPSLPYVKLSSKVGAFWIFQKVCVITSKPKAILLDSRGRLHNEQGPAIVYPDGWGVYAWHGVRVPRYVIEDPGQISVRKINSEVNTEVRRVLIERLMEQSHWNTNITA